MFLIVPLQNILKILVCFPLSHQQFIMFIIIQAYKKKESVNCNHLHYILNININKLLI